MRAVLVDDEHLALRGLKEMLESDIGGIEIVDMCSEPRQVVELMTRHRPDVVFLDIHMPEINGLKLGEELKAAVPGIEIVFVTGYDRYAVKAFELYALDYVMKPIESERLRRTVQRLRDRLHTSQKKKMEINRPCILCFNQLRFQLPGKEPQMFKWRTSKAQELFAYLLHHRGRRIERSTLIELLWPDFEMSRAVQQLYATVYQIRQTLKNSGMDSISIQNGDLEVGYRLEIGDVQIDVEEWERQLKQLKALGPDHIDAHEHALKLFEGNYLGDYEYLWAEYERERLRQLWLQHARNLSRFYMDQGRLQAAVQVNQRIQQQLPDEEETYFTLMMLYDELGDKGGVEEQYWLLRARVEGDLESAVPRSIYAWYERWRQRNYAI